MKKRLLILAAVLLLAGAAQAQIFLQDGDENNTRAMPNAWPELPGSYAQGVDDYVPTGSGMILLAALSGAYLLGKRNSKATKHGIEKIK